MSFNCEEVINSCFELLKNIVLKVIELKEMIENKQNTNECNNILTKLLIHLKEMNNYLKTISRPNINNNSMYGFIDQIYGHFEEVITSEDEVEDNEELA